MNYNDVRVFASRIPHHSIQDPASLRQGQGIIYPTETDPPPGARPGKPRELTALPHSPPCPAACPRVRLRATPARAPASIRPRTARQRAVTIGKGRSSLLAKASLRVWSRIRTRGITREHVRHAGADLLARGGDELGSLPPQGWRPLRGRAVERFQRPAHARNRCDGRTQAQRHLAAASKTCPFPAKEAPASSPRTGTATP